MATAPALPRPSIFRPRIDVRRHDGIKASDRVALFRQLRTMFCAGTPIHESLVVASEQTESRRMEAVMRDIASQVSAGAPLSDAMGAHPEVFRSEWVQLINSAEISGTLERALERIAAQIEEAASFRSKVISAMMYPATVLAVSILAVIAMLTFVVPTFQELFAESDKTLPGPTQTLITVSDFIRNEWALLIGGTIALFFAGRAVMRNEIGRMTVVRIIMAVPVIGPLLVQRNMQRFARNVSDLLDSGVPVLETLGAMRRISIGNPVYRDALGEIVARVQRGDTLSESVSETGVYTPFLCNMLKVGEETGSLPEVLAELADYYRERVETFTARAASQVETLLIILMSCLVGSILIALYLPLFELSAG